MKRFLVALFLGATSLVAAAPVSIAAPSGAVETTPISVQAFHKKPKLVLVIVVDQFRADYLTRFQSRFLPAAGKDGSIGGYNFLMSKGAYFPFAQYDVLQCMTGPGHAMILSGSYPYQMGIPGNGWLDQTSGKSMYCVGDEAQPIVGAKGKGGVSPKNFWGSTLGDELKNAGYPARVVTIALKDRAAILLGGRRADLAMWFDPASFSWVSSKYYLPEEKLPSWLQEHNASLAKRKGETYVWKPEGKPTGLSSNDSFSISLPIGDKKSLATPLGLELLATVGERAFDQFSIGRGKATDIFAMSFSSHDYLAHQFGPNSLEMEELTVAEDRVLSRFFTRVKKKLGSLDDVVIVLTSDHGAPPLPKWVAAQKMDSGQVLTDEVVARLEERLSSKFGKPSGGKWIGLAADLNFYFTPEAIEKAGERRTQVEEEVKALLKSVKGVAFVFSRTDYFQRRLPPGMLERNILKTYVPGRSGDVIAIPKAFYSDDGDPLVHMTSYSYDRTVPLVIAGPKIRAGVYSTAADVVDLAPTLSFLLGIVEPATSEGRVLSEIIGK